MAAEKKGDTGKLDYDFNRFGVCEVCIDNEWFRVTERDFRSFDGKRRITSQSDTAHRHLEALIDITMATTEYEGPVYMWGTNTTVPYKGTEKVITSPALDAQRKLTNSRAW